MCCDAEAGSVVKKCLKSHGDLKLAFVITKGQFELDVICAKELTGSSAKKPGVYAVHGRLLNVCTDVCSDARIFNLRCEVYFAVSISTPLTIT